MVAKLFHLPVDLGALMHEFSPSGGDIDKVALLRAAKRLKMKARLAKVRWPRLLAMPFPVIWATREGGWVAVTGARPGAGGEAELLVADPGAGEARVVPLAEARERLSGEVVMLAPRGQSERSRKVKFGFSWFMPALRKYRTHFGEILAVSLVINVLGLAMPLFFQVIMDKILAHGALETMQVLSIGICCVIAFNFLFEFLRTYVLQHTASRIDVQLGAQLFWHMLRLPQTYFEARPVGLTVARAQELESIRAFLTSSVLVALLDCLFIFVYLAVLIYYSGILSLVVLGALAAFVVISATIAPFLRRLLEEKFRRGAANQSFLVESVSGIAAIKAAAVEERMGDAWNERLAAYVTISFKTSLLAALGSNLIQTVNMGMTVAILGFGVGLVLTQELTVGQLIAFNMIAGRVSAPVIRLAQMWQDFQQVSVSLERLGDILETPTELSEGLLTDLPPIRGDIEFQNVCYRYPGREADTLEDISFTVRAGQRIGIVGESGSGKSTLTRLVEKLGVPRSGRILIDDVDLAMASPAWLRRQLGVVLQDDRIFKGTIRDNIALGQPDVAAEKVIAAAQMAGAHDFILETEGGYQTPLEEGGTNLSGGQRQRLAIARALLKDPPVLIFDEATSALDYKSEAIIQRNLAEISRNRTMLIVSHRLSVIRDCDLIIVIHQGRIVEKGDHEQLLAKDGAYAELLRRQTA